jgi:transcriptional regulator with XRE-family HTH domain
MSKLPVLIDTIMRLKRCTQAEIAEKAGLHRSNLSRFLAGDIDMRMSSLESILSALDISLEEVLQKEINQIIGKKSERDTLGDALEVLLKQADPITARTMIESLAARSKAKTRDRHVLDALTVVNSYKSKLRVIRGH